ncbi:MAG: hypothetical protein DI535_23320 [Citrobacter freundii]|nr:MAG: hypothetical protein DI535_23320 [Citrobacter freundii]
MTTIHQYLNKYPVDPDSKTLIIGTIHPHNVGMFKLDFFYGSEASIWNILSDAFPDELLKPVTLQSLQAFLKQRKISVSDTIVECNRKNPTALDSDLIPVKLNHDLIRQIRDSSIDHLVFTSGFGKNNAFRLFYTGLLGQPITDELKRQRNFILPDKFFGRPLQVTIVYSPSGAANISLSRSKEFKANRHLFAESKRPVYDFKVWVYKQVFR